MDKSNISRLLENGWNYRPDWRAAIVECRIKEQTDSSIDRLYSGEEDLVIRQALRFHVTGGCAASKSLQWANSCYANRSKHIASGIVQSMTIAGCNREQIASRVGTAPLNVTFFQLLYFDVRRYLHMREWVASIAIPANLVTAFDPIGLKTRMLMATAFHHGMSGLNRMMTGAIPKPGAELEQLNADIRAAITVRAHEAMMMATLTSPGSEDLARFIEFSRVPSAQSSDKQRDKLQQFGENIRRLIMLKPVEITATAVPGETQRPASQAAEPAPVEEFFSRS